MFKLYESKDSGAWTSGERLRKVARVVDANDAAGQIFYSTNVSHPNVVRAIDASVSNRLSGLLSGSDERHLSYRLDFPNEGVVLGQTPLLSELQVLEVLWGVLCGLRRLRQVGVEADPTLAIASAMDKSGTYTEDFKGAARVTGKLFDLGRTTNSVLKFCRVASDFVCRQVGLRITPLVIAMRSSRTAFDALNTVVRDTTRAQDLCVDIEYVALNLMTESISEDEALQLLERALTKSYVALDAAPGECKAGLGSRIESLVQRRDALGQDYARRNVLGLTFVESPSNPALKDLRRLYCAGQKDRDCAIAQLLGLREAARRDAEVAELFRSNQGTWAGWIGEFVLGDALPDLPDVPLDDEFFRALVQPRKRNRSE